MNRSLSGGVMTCAAALILANPVHAQAPKTDVASGAEGDLTEVTVTGSRVITNGNDSPTPLTVISADELQATHPAPVFESLLDLPAFAGSRGSEAPIGGAGGGNNSQINALSLSSLGAVRTLVLYDGHRVPATEYDGLVDVNTIPQMLLQRVDIVTGGASAVYGSDAIGGVVNFITDRKFNGVKFEAQGGISGHQDDGTYQAGVAFGTNVFDGRGHIEGSIGTNFNDGLTHDQRQEFQQRWTIQGSGTAALPYFLTPNTTSNFWTFGGLITGPANNPLRGMQFVSGGVLVPFVHGSTAGLPANASLEIGGDGAYEQNPSVISQRTIDQAFGRFDFDVTDDLHYYVAVSGTYDHDFNWFGNSGIQNLKISATNAYLAPAYQQQLAAAGITSFTFGRKFALGSPVLQSSNDFFTHNLFVNTGFEGKLGDYKWDLSYVRSNNGQETRSNWTPNQGRLFAALDAVKDPASGNIVCRVTLTNPGLYPGCVPVNVFGPNSESAAAADWIRQIGIETSKMPTDDVSGSISGAPFNDWAGPVNIALSGEWRHQSFEMQVNNPTVNYAPLDCTGLLITGNCTPATATNVGSQTFAGGSAPRPPVSMTVSEAALETDAPLLKDLPFARSLDVNLGYRYAKYRAEGNPDITQPNLTSTFNANTWKAGLVWHANDVMTVRATRSRDIRAPNLSDLFLTNTTTFNSALSTIDLLTGSNSTAAGASPATVTGGNPTLHPEVASTTTLGVVIQPTSAFSMSLDAFDISIANFITRISGSDPTIQNGCYAGYSYYCTLQVRPGPLTDTSKANSVYIWYTRPVNISELKTRGLDFETNYKLTVLSRPLTLRGLVTYQPHVLFMQPGTVTQDYAGAYGTAIATSAAGPQLRATAFAHYDVTGEFAVDWMTRWRDSEHLSPDSTVVVSPNTIARAASFSNLTLTYRLKGPSSGNSSLYLNITNVFNQTAPIVANFATSSQPGFFSGWVPGDDPIGRYYNLGVRFRL
jgi:outer membrane receptor protein involved in Fe transport